MSMVALQARRKIERPDFLKIEAPVQLLLPARMPVGHVRDDDMIDQCPALIRSKLAGSASASFHPANTTRSLSRPALP
jgi:hypothetical protein